jgi:hypothetical protein
LSMNKKKSFSNLVDTKKILGKLLQNKKSVGVGIPPTIENNPLIGLNVLHP